MEKSEIIEKINGALAEEFEKDASSFALDADLKQVLGFDSLDLVDLTVLIEQKLGVKVHKDDFGKIKTFDDFYSLLYKKINGGD